MNTDRHEHLTYEELEGYVDRTIDDIDREIVESKIETCATCREDSESLVQFANSLSRSSAHAVGIGGAPLGWAAAALLAIVLGGFWTTHRPRPLVQGPQLVTQLFDNGRAIGLDSKGSLIGLGALPATERLRIRTLLAGGELSIPPVVDQIAATTGTLRGAPQATPEVRLIEPVGRVVQSSTPTLRWTAVDGATYAVTVFDSKYRAVLSSGTLRVPAWTLTAPLARGQIYAWQVTVSEAGRESRVPVPPEPEAKFAVLSRDAAARLQQLSASFGNSHLVMGNAYAEAGLVPEAQTEFRKLLEANPSSPVAARLLRNVSSRKTPA